MHFLAGLGKKLLGDKAKKKLTDKARGNLPATKTPLLLIGSLLVGLGLFPIILILLMVAVVCYIVFAPIEGVVNFVQGIFNAVGDFFGSVVNFFSYGSFADDKTTYYNELKKHYDYWMKEGVSLDVAWIASATNYARLADLNESGECTPEADEDGNVTGCSETTDYGAMTSEVKELVDGMILKDGDVTRIKTEDEYKAWMLDDSSGKSWIERHMEQVDIDIPTQEDKKKEFLEDAVEQIYLMKDAYNDIIDSMNKYSTCGTYQEIKVCDTGNSLKDIAYAEQNWAAGTGQYKIWNMDKGSGLHAIVEGANEFGELKSDELGFYYIESEGIKYYCTAVASYYSGTIGDKFRITLDSGAVFHIIVADQKADIHTHAGNNDSYPHCLSGTGGMLEFYVKRDFANKLIGSGGLNRDFGNGRNFAGAVTKVEKITGSTSCTGEFGFTGEVDKPIKEENKISLDYNLFAGNGNPFSIPQCTWFAWARFYQVYGYDSGARGHGRYNASEIVNAHPDKFKLSNTPAPGSVFSYQMTAVLPEYGHVGFVEAFDGENLWLSEGNATVNGVSGAMWFHRTTWAAFKQQFPDVQFAVPIK